MTVIDDFLRPFPGVIRIEPAGSCNLRCSHCPTGTVQMARGIMRKDTFSHVLDSLRPVIDDIRVVVLYHGGEPLLYKRFPEMIVAIKELGVPFVKTVSNGMLLTDAMAEGLVTSGLDHIEFSLDGTSAAVSDIIRRKSEYEVVVRNIKRLIDTRRRLGSQTPEIFLSNTQFVTPERKDEQPQTPAHMIEEFAGEYEGEIAGYKCFWAMRWPHMELLEDLYDVYYDPDGVDSNECDHVDNTMTIRWDGDVVACCYDLTSELVMGNVKDADLATIWNDAPYVDLRRSIETMEFVDMCANCNVVRPNAYLLLKPESAPAVATREALAAQPHP